MNMEVSLNSHGLLYTDVPLHEDVTEYLFRESIYTHRTPAVLRGVDIGPCCEKWTPEYLSSKVGKKEVKIHVTTDPCMNFLKKNFAYKTLPFSELIRRVALTKQTEYFFSANETYYLRSLGFDVRGNDVADIRKQFPDLANDIKFPHFFDKEAFFSSVFRIASQNVQLWTHYDIMDNMLIQVRGRKKVILYSPKDSVNLYMQGDKSEVVNIDEPDLKAYPKFARAVRHECLLEPGDILFIPALWFHNVVSLDSGVAVNVFWRHLHPDMYNKKDTYGNKDLVPAARAMQTLESALKQLDVLPVDYRDFYMRRMLTRLHEKVLSVGNSDVLSPVREDLLVRATVQQQHNYCSQGHQSENIYKRC